MTGEWWQERELTGCLDQALNHINMANDAATPDEVTRCRGLFDGLNQCWSAYRAATNRPHAADADAIRRLLAEGIPAERRTWLCGCPSIRAVAESGPSIQDHDALRRSTANSPFQPLPRELEETASEKRRRQKNHPRRWREASSSTAQGKLLESLAALLSMVRSTMAEGEKTANGPGPGGAARDREVAAVTIPVLEDVFEALFGFPSRRLAVYGTLAPGERNHPVIAGIEGSWSDGHVDGVVRAVAGYPAFTWKKGKGTVRVRVLTSEALPKHWHRIDGFEGGLYRRILVPVHRPAGSVIAHIYESRAATAASARF